MPSQDEIEGANPVMEVIESSVNYEFPNVGDLLPGRVDYNITSSGTYSMSTFGSLYEEGTPESVDPEKSYLTELDECLPLEKFGLNSEKVSQASS